MKELLSKLVEEQKYSDALELLKKNISKELQLIRNDVDYCIIAASICIDQHEYDMAFDLITLGLANSDDNYELYLLLGEYYYSQNIDQALLCFYQALYYCHDDGDSAIIQNFISDAIEAGAHIAPVSIVIVADDSQSDKLRTVNSVYSTVPKWLFEVILVEDGISDISEDDLGSFDNLKFISLSDGAGFIKSCNIGIKHSDIQNDIMILNCNYELMNNSFFYLMLGLYNDKKTGAVSALTNNEAELSQKVSIDDSDAYDYARSINTPYRNAYEKKTFLRDFAILISRKALDSVGLFDEQLSPCGFEDCDYGMRLLLAKYELITCYNSFINYFGNNNEDSDEDSKRIEKNKQYLREKWNFDITYSNVVRTELIELIEDDPEKEIEVLELGCAMGSNLNRIQFHWPNSKAYGVEYDEDVVRIGKNASNIIQGDVESMAIPYKEKQFDYIICADVLEHLREPQKTLERFKPYLKDDGCFIISLPNIRYYGVSAMLLLQGKFEYADSGILDRTHLKFFTRNTAIEMIEKSGLEILRMERNVQHEQEAKEFADKIQSTFDVTDVDEISVFQYYFVARKKML